ncbi:hypothetical protein GOP47_0006361 [Adiantum capillus-veneris]|uniref:Phosphoinositide phospholipase C n=1 Tax=Adiantum capillus-veneris TaxID=13818 RepID=A0A9D4V2Q7_ADICA|nr:hypothetical protein GOP47_0006361 [Adiantum capillus-veneris]
MPKLSSRHGRSRPTLLPGDAGPAVSQEIRTLFQKFSSNGCMHASHFCKFLNEVQQDTDVLTEAQASELMKSCLNALPEPQVNEKQFLLYLFDTQLNFAIRNQIHQDMNLPLSHYYIFTGHNSYLTGNQLSSKSSEKPIIKALQKGVRVVELDLWPGNNEDINVVHGRTLTSPVTFEACISAIKENAFVKSQYPLIITLEDHLPVNLQAKAAKVIMDTFGSQLWYPPPTQELAQFPSPWELKGKILISTKPPKECRQASIKSRYAEQNSDSSDRLWDEEDDIDDDKDKPPEQRKFVSQDYMKIIAIRQGKMEKSLSGTLRVEEHAKRISLSEPQLSKIAESSPATVVQFTRDNILRVYPRGWRVDSSNYNPVKAWLLGAQMVAVNIQGYGKHLWVAQGLFRANGGCGYVKKPNFLISNDSTSSFNYNSKASTLEVKQMLKVKVCMGCGWREQLGEDSFDKSSPPDFFARVGIAGVKADKVMMERAMKKDEWEPSWDEEFVFTLRVPELAVLRIEVQEDNRTGQEFAGQICLPVSELRAGYRVVNLCDTKGNTWDLVKLLLHIDLSYSSSSWFHTNRHYKKTTRCPIL